MRQPTSTILIELRERAIQASVANGRILLRAADGQQIPRSLQTEVAANKGALVEVLTTAPWLVEAPLSVFAQCQVAVEVFVPGLPETLWFASDAGQADRLVAEG